MGWFCYFVRRTVDEFSAGHAVGAKNIPYMLKLGSGNAWLTDVFGILCF